MSNQIEKIYIDSKLISKRKLRGPDMDRQPDPYMSGIIPKQLDLVDYINKAINQGLIQVTAVSESFTATIGNGVHTEYEVSHNLGTRDVAIHIYDNVTFEDQICNIFRETLNSVRLSFDDVVDLNSLNVVIKK